MFAVLGPLQLVLQWFLEKLGAWFLALFAQIRSVGESVLHGAMTALSSVFPTVSWSAMQTYLDQINYFFPLSECVSMGLVLFTVWFTVWSYRAVKSWIPTVSGT